MIIVTGGCGFIGSNLVNGLCRQQDKVIICDYKQVFRKEYFSDIDKIEIIEPSEILDFIRKKRISVIYHLGAISSTTNTNGNQV